MKLRSMRRVCLVGGMLWGGGTTAYAQVGVPVSQSSLPSFQDSSVLPPAAAVASGASATSRQSVSIVAHLQLSSGQMQRLDRIFDGYAPHRAKQEGELAQLQTELQGAQAPTTFDERRASRVLRDIGKAQENLRRDALKTRGKALEVLTSVQRTQLNALATDERLEWREDSYSLLLLSTLDGVSEGGLDRQVINRDAIPRGHGDNGRRDPGTGSVNVYAGYGYGRPQYGVFGNYGQGPVGVYGGVGNYGPSVGVSVGGVFTGGLWSGWTRRR